MTTENSDNAIPGTSGSNTNPGGEGEKSKEKTVSYETYLKTLDEAKSAKSKLKAQEDALNKIQDEKMKADGDWKGLLEARENRIRELTEQSETLGKKYGALNERITNSQKLSMVISKLGGNLDEKYYGLIDLEGIKTNPETGEIDDMSATKIAESFRTMYPETIKKGFNPNAMGETRGSANSTQSMISRDEWLKLSYSEQKKWPISRIK